MRARASGLAWTGCYLALVFVPLGILLVGDRPRGGGFWWDFSLALGYAGLSMMGVQFALTARFKRATAPFGIDIIYYFHRYLAIIALVLLLAHAGILSAKYPGAAGSFDLREAPATMIWGWLGLIAFMAVLVTSLGRRLLRIEYDTWRRIHVVLAVAGVAMAVLHVFGSGHFLTSPIKRGLWTLLGASWLGLVVWVRLIRPAQLLKYPFRVVEVRPERGRSWTLTLEPEADGSAALDYRPGQFVWLTLDGSPFAMREHPFSYASSPTRSGRLEFTIKELGDFTQRIGQTRPGTLAYVDGPYGAFCIDRWPSAPGFVFVAGGVGIAPIMSSLRALADRRDGRPLWLFYGNRTWEGVVFREELAELSARCDLHVVHVLGEPPPDWECERGWITREVMARHLPENRVDLECLICGPTPMIRLVERGLRDLDVPLRQIHSEIFDLA